MGCQPSIRKLPPQQQAEADLAKNYYSSGCAFNSPTTTRHSVTHYDEQRTNSVDGDAQDYALKISGPCGRLLTS